MYGCLDMWRNGKIDYSFEEDKKVIKVLEIKGIQKGKVNELKDGDIVLSIPKKKTYKQYLKEVSKLKF